MKKVISFFTISVFFYSIGVCQMKQKELEILVKLALFNESMWPDGTEVTEEVLNSFLKLDYKADTLRTSGIASKYLFLSINPILKNTEGIDLANLPLAPENCKEYILAVNILGKKVYRLKGFSGNDFCEFAQDVSSDSGRRVSKSAKRYFVERLDLQCLNSLCKRWSKRPSCLTRCSTLIHVE